MFAVEQFSYHIIWILPYYTLIFTYIDIYGLDCDYFNWSCIANIRAYNFLFVYFVHIFLKYTHGTEILIYFAASFSKAYYAMLVLSAQICFIYLILNKNKKINFSFFFLHFFWFLGYFLHFLERFIVLEFFDSNYEFKNYFKVFI